MARPLVMLTGDETAEPTNNQSEPVLPSIQLARFADPGQLEPVGDGLFLATPASGPPQVGAPGTLGVTALCPMCLERSNVVIARERRQLRQIGEWLELVRPLAQE
jgi:flagellar basal-body rod protein FlgG